MAFSLFNRAKSSSTFIAWSSFLVERRLAPGLARLKSYVSVAPHSYARDGMMVTTRKLFPPPTVELNLRDLMSAVREAKVCFGTTGSGPTS
jgi:hypothetical protein